MQKQTQIDLNLIDTDDLINEIARRHDEIIIIRENRKDSELVDIRTKTHMGKFANPELGFDILFALQLLQAAENQMIMDYLGAEQEDNDGNDAPQDNNT